VLRSVSRGVVLHSLVLLWPRPSQPCVGAREPRAQPGQGWPSTVAHALCDRAHPTSNLKAPCRARRRQPARHAARRRRGRRARRRRRRRRARADGGRGHFVPQERAAQVPGRRRSRPLRPGAPALLPGCITHPAAVCTGHHSSLWWRPWPTRRLAAPPLPAGCLAWVLRQLARTCRAAVPSLAPLLCRALRCQTEGLIEGLKSAAGEL